MQQYDTTSEDKLNFQYSDINDPVLSRLKETATLELGPSLNETEEARVILGYVHSLFAHNGDNQPSANDPLTILKETRSGKEFRCVEYSILGAALLWAFGIPARMVGLKTGDVETREYGAGHVVVEYWSRENEKWVMCDVQAGIIPTHNDIPLSAFELGESIRQNKTVDYIPVDGSRFPDGNFTGIGEYIDWVIGYLYFFDTMTVMTFSDVDRQREEITMLVPIGVKPPKTFQGAFEMNVVHTQSVRGFYAAPPEGLTRR